MKGLMICVLNGLPAILGVLFYAGGAPLWIPLFLLLSILLLWMNYRAGQRVGQLALYDGILLLSTFLGNYLSGQLYFSRICDDLVGRAINLGITLLCCALVLLVSVLQLVVRLIQRKRLLRR